MASVKFKGLDTNKLLHEIQKGVEKDLKKNPEKVLDEHIGDTVAGNCARCGNSTIEILSNGKARCTKCGLTTKVDLKIEYK